jgi:hypothetical protein
MGREYKLNCSIKPKAHVLTLIGSVVTVEVFRFFILDEKNLELYIFIQW